MWNAGVGSEIDGAFEHVDEALGGGRGRACRRVRARRCTA